MGNYYLGLDVGIGSIGWAVINVEKKRIEDFGVRIFKSGEVENKNERYSQQRRRYRGMRRLIRRKSHRKLRLKKYLQLLGFTTTAKINEYYEKNCNNVIHLRYRGISEKLSPEEIAACLIHICNNRGYKDFYEVNIDEIDDPEAKQEYAAVSHIKELMNNNGYRTPAEMICRCKEFEEPNSVFRKYHNKDSSSQTNIISRYMLEEEVSLILKNQQQYYACLDKEAIDNIKKIIFRQRDFETGPGKENDKFRKFTGYIDALGKCRFFKDLDRGNRFTAIADIYALVNTLSQYSYINNENKNILTSELAKELIGTALKNGSLQKRDLKDIAKKHGITINDNTGDTQLAKCFKYIKVVKPIFEKNGFNWDELICNYTDENNNLLNKVGIVLSQSQTPQRRIDKLKQLSYDFSDDMISKLSKLKLSGTVNVSYKYMRGSITAFLEGDIYGKYQNEINKEVPPVDEDFKPLKLPPFKNEDDCEFFKNPVVFRAINETRKLINAIIDKYGYPVAVNIETADELNKTFEDRAKDTKRKNANEKENDRLIKEICDCIGCDETAARPLMEKLKLWEAQGGKCLYSGRDIPKEIMLKDKDKLFEVDHIIPYSLILDNTINNKALVFTDENQAKRQRTPLMYMNETQAEGFRARVNFMLKNKKCSKNKYQYLMLENLDNVSLLDEWKSRNLNDTRYICKYLVNYLKNNLRFNTDDPDILNRKDFQRVYAVKSSFTSMFRRQWLNEKTWGQHNKGDLKKITYLDHAADAIVVANCRPEYVILAGEKRKLNKMYYQAGKKRTAEYEASKKACIDSLYKFNGMPPKVSEALLSGHTSRLTPIVPDLQNEVDKRLWDKNIFNLFWKDENTTENDCEEIFRNNMRFLYKDDPGFAASLQMPLISLKPERKYKGSVTTDNAISIKNINGEFKQLKRTSITKIKETDIENIYTDDKVLIDSLKEVFAQGKYKDIEDYLKKTDQPFFVTNNGARVNKVTIISKAPARWLTKKISDNNYTLMDDKSYYCIELYKDGKGNSNLQGIAMSDIIKKDGKLYLKPDFKYTDDYKTHVMYIFAGDYIRAKDSKGNIKFEGYYRSIKNINRNQLYITADNAPDNMTPSIAKKDSCIKLSVDIMGNISGENDGEGIKCGELLSLLKEKN